MAVKLAQRDLHTASILWAEIKKKYEHQAALCAPFKRYFQVNWIMVNLSEC